MTDPHATAVIQAQDWYARIPSFLKDRFVIRKANKRDKKDMTHTQRELIRMGAGSGKIFYNIPRTAASFRPVRGMYKQ